MTMVTRFRAATRNSQVDAERITPVHGEVQKALRSLEREREGLGRRLEEARMRAAALMGTEDGIYGEREPADEKLLVEAEAQMMGAYDRLKALKAQHAVLASIARELEKTEAGAQRPPSSQSAPGWRGAWLSPARLGQGAAMLGWALLIAIPLSAAADAAGRAAAPSPEVLRFLAFLGAALALAIAYPRHRLALLGAGLAWILASAAVAAQDEARLALPVKVLGLVAALALPPIVQWFVRYRRRGSAR